MPLLLSGVARGAVVLANYSACYENFDKITEEILSTIPPHDEKFYSIGNLFHYIAENRLVFFCITDDITNTSNVEKILKRGDPEVEFMLKGVLKRKLEEALTGFPQTRARAFLFLNEIKRRFITAFGDTVQTAIPYAMKSEFERVIATELEHYNDSPDLDTSRVLQELADLEDIIVQNEGGTFRWVCTARARTGQRSLFKMYVIIITLVVVALPLVVYLIGDIVCGGLAWKSCVG